MRPPARLAVAVVALAFAAAGFGASAVVLGRLEPGSRAAGWNTGSVAFAAPAEETWQIFSAELDGTGLVQLTDIAPPFVVANPAWSPDGSMLAYVVRGSDTDRSDIWVMRADGSDAHPITDGRGSKRTPAWSPDGTRIAFTNGYDIHVMNADGTNARNLTPGSSNLCASDPTWSPDGGHIAFVGAEVDDDGGDIACLGHDVDDDLYIMRSDGREMHTLFSAPGAQREPTWSPAGSTIAFADHTQAPGSDLGELTFIDPVGRVIGRVSDLPEGAQAPAWSSDGRQIAFMANVAGDDHQTIFVMNADGTDVREVPGLPTDALWPAWQPLSETSEPSPSESLPAGPEPLPRADPRVTATIPVGPTGSTSALLYAEGSVWVSASFVEGGGGVDDAMLIRIDATTNEIVAEIPLQGVSGFVSGGGGLAYGFGSVWVAGYGHVEDSMQTVVHRIDPMDNVVTAMIPVGGTHGADVAVDQSNVWVGYFGEESAGVARIDPETDSVTAQVSLPSDYVRRITAADGGVVATELEWDHNGGPCTVLTAIDPATATITARERVHPPCGGVQLFAWNDEIWASGTAMQRVDPMTAHLVGEPIPFEPERFPRSFVFGTGREVWFAAYPGSNGVRPDRVARLDAASGEIEYFIEAGGVDAVFAPETRTIWILEYGGSLTRVDINDV